MAAAMAALKIILFISVIIKIEIPGAKECAFAAHFRITSGRIKVICRNRLPFCLFWSSLVLLLLSALTKLSGSLQILCLRPKSAAYFLPAGVGTNRICPYSQSVDVCNAVAKATEFRLSFATLLQRPRSFG